MAIFTNQATLSYNNTVTTSNITTGELLEVLSATKTALRSTYTAQDTAVYLVQLVNSGTLPFTALTVSDDLGTYDYDGTTLTLHYTTYYEFYFNEELGFEDTRPVEMDATEQFQFQLDPDGLPTNISEHPRLGQLVIFEPRNTEDPITQLLAMITQYG